MEKRSFRAALVSVVAGSLICAFKFIAFFYTDSSAILSDALESIINVVAAIFAAYSIHVSARAADEDHPYGHDRMEYFSGGAEGVLILLAGIVIFYDALGQFIHGSKVRELGGGILLITLASLLNGILGFYLLRTGKRCGSVALQADGHHVITDFFTSLGLIGGLGLVYITGYMVLDSILAMGMAIWIVWNGFRILRGNFHSLMDRVDPTLLASVSRAINANRCEEMIHPHKLRVREMGARMIVDFHVIMPFFLKVARVHEIEVAFTRRLKKELGRDVDLMMHTDPCIPEDCPGCLRKRCRCRKSPIIENFIRDPGDLISDINHPFGD